VKTTILGAHENPREVACTTKTNWVSNDAKILTYPNIDFVRWYSKRVLQQSRPRIIKMMES